MRDSTDAAWFCMRGCLLVVWLAFVFGSARSALADTLQDRLKDPDTFAVCKAVDLASTAVILHNGGTEYNPIMRGILAHGWLLPVALSVGVWYWLREAHNDTVTEVVSGVTCGVAAHNILVM